MKPKVPLPVTILSGFLGAGKTTLLNYILKKQNKYKVAVIVNDMSEFNVDVKLVKTDGKIIEFSNGCICCTLREDLFKEIQSLASSNLYDYLLIESTGISEPKPVAETFTFETGDDESLKDFARLDTMVTLVNAQQYLSDQTTTDYLKDRKLESEEDDERSISNLLLDQVEFANILVINKCDLVDEKQIGALRAYLSKVNPDAKIVESTFGKVDLDLIFNTQTFDFEKAATTPGWLRELRGSHVPETVEYGVTSFIYRRVKPFNPLRLSKAIEENVILKNVLRSKGFVWMCTDMDTFLIWQTAGEILRLEPGGEFYASMEESEWDPEDVEDIKRDWDEKWGDRRQELVFIGIDMKEDDIVKILDSCLLNDEEMKQTVEEWAEYEDPIVVMIDEGDEDHDCGDPDCNGEHDEDEDDHDCGDPECDGEHDEESEEEEEEDTQSNLKRKHNEQQGSRKNSKKNDLFDTYDNRKVEEKNETRDMSDEDMLKYQKRVMEQQDLGLDGLSISLDRTKAIGSTIGEELDEHKRLLDDLDGKVGKTQSNIKKQTRRIEDVIKASRIPLLLCCIIVLIIIAVVVLILMLKIIIGF